MAGSLWACKIDIYDVEPIQLKARALSEGPERHGQAAHQNRPWERRVRDSP